MKGNSGGFNVFIITGVQYTKKKFDEPDLPSGGFVRSFSPSFRRRTDPSRLRIEPDQRERTLYETVVEGRDPFGDFAGVAGLRHP